MSVPYLTFRNISFFPKEIFGLKEVNFDLYKRKKYHLILQNEDKLKALLGLMEGRFREYFGTIRKESKIFTQSDRLLLGDKVYKQTVRHRLAMKDPFTFFDGQRRSKHNFIDKLKAKHLIDWPIYRLKGEDKIKFSLLSLAFQETGLIIISQLQGQILPANCPELLQQILEKTSCLLCVASTGEPLSLKQVAALPIKDLNQIDLTAC